MAASKAREAAPPQELARLAAEVSRGDLSPLYVFRGDEAYFRMRLVRVLVPVADERGYELCRHDAKDPDFSLPRLLDDLAGGALFASARLVVVENAGPLITKSSGKYAPGFEKAVLARAADGAEGMIVLGVDKLAATTTFAKKIKELGGRFYACRKLWATPSPWGDPDPRRTELARWVVARARELGVKLSTEEAVYVGQATGNDLAAVDSQLARLRERGAAGLREVVSWEAGASPFDLAEHLVNGDARAAMHEIEALFRGGFQGRQDLRTVDAGGLNAILIGAVGGKVREALRASRAIAAGDPVEVAMDAAGVRKGLGRDGARARIERHGPARWSSLLEDLTDLERSTRTGGEPGASAWARLALRWGVRARAR